MRVVAIICAILAAVLSILAALWTRQVVLGQTDSEALIGAFALVCVAAPFALIAAILSLLNRRKWRTVLIIGSLGTVAFVLIVGLWLILF